VITTPTRALEFGYPPGTRSVGVHFKAWEPAVFLPMPAGELCDRPVTLEDVWDRPTIAALRDRLATAAGPHEMLTLLEDQLMRLVCETASLGLVRQTSSVIAAEPSSPTRGGYYDQAHFGHDFRAFTGLTPTHYLDARRRFMREHPGHVLDVAPLPAD
jgi:hypothetical protein